MSQNILNTLNNIILPNKFYLYKNKIVKVKKILKFKNTVCVCFIEDDCEEEIPLMGADLLLKRVYTIGDVAKIIQRKSDTIRKYEKMGLIDKPSIDMGGIVKYSNWRLYSKDDVFSILDFFSDRSPGRPVKESKDPKSSLKQLNQKLVRK